LQAISLRATEIASLLLFKRRRACGQGKLLIVIGSLLGELARINKRLYIKAGRVALFNRDISISRMIIIASSHHKLSLTISSKVRAMELAVDF